MKRTSMDQLSIGSNTRLLARTFLGVTMATFALGCGAEAIDAGEAPIAETESPVISGTPVSSNTMGVVAVYHGFVRPCSGTLIRSNWVLTAKHCLLDPVKKDGVSLIPDNVVKVTAATAPGLQPPATGVSTGTLIMAHPFQDIAVVQVFPPLTAKPVGIWNGNPSALLGSTVRAMGYGRSVDGGDENVENGSSGAGTLRMADLQVTAVNAVDFTVALNGSGQIVWHGDSGGPSYRMTDMLGRNLPGVAGVHQTSSWHSNQTADDGLVPQVREWIKRTVFSPGDHNRDWRADIALVGGSGWGTVPLAIANASGGFDFMNKSVSGFASWAQTAGARPVAGDFNGDSVADIVLVGGSGWTTVPMAMSQGNGTFNVLNLGHSQFAGWTQIANVRAVAGDFNGDGKSDIALSGASGWNSIPVAFSFGNGTFGVTNVDLPNFPGWASSGNVKILGGDFDGDGRDDIALTGGIGWGTIPVAFSNGDGTFTVRVGQVPNFTAWAALAGAQAVAGDFNGDGRDDIALTGVQGWGSIPIAFSNGDGGFTVANQQVSDFPAWAALSGAKAVVGDYDADARDDIALTGVSGWGSIPVARSIGNGTFTVRNPAVASFPGFAATSGAKPVSGH